MKRIALIITLISLVGCNPTEITPESENSVSLASNNISANENNGQWVTVTTSQSWTIGIEYLDEQTGWASLTRSSGVGDGLVRLNYVRNIKATERSLDVVVAFGDGRIERVTLTQGAGTGEKDFENSLSIDSGISSAQAGQQTVTISSAMSWTASLVYASVSGWASLDEYTGSGDKLLSLGWVQNTTTQSRTVAVKVVFEGGEELTETMTQSGVGENAVQIATGSIQYNYTSAVAITVISELSWSAALEYTGQTGWASLSKTSGTGNSTVNLTATANSQESGRALTVKFSFTGGDIKTVYLTQSGAPTTPPGPSTTPPWREMPEVVLPNSNYYFVTHFAPIANGSTVRNYSILYDASTWTAYWLAYPMSRAYQGGAGRNEDWQYDPLIPQNKQVYLKSSYGGGGSGNEVNSRGHQVASGDRQATVAQNKQTFYFTNMTPQKQGFNGVVWERLESRIQDLASAITDTLWCVTGAIIQTVGGNETIQYVSKDSKEVPFPNYYYKVIIRKSGSSYKGIGFWFEHFNRTVWSTYPTYPRDVMTIREIEALTGFNFFYNLTETEQTAAECSVDQSFWTGLI